MSPLPNISTKLSSLADRIRFRTTLQTGTLLMPSCISEPTDVQNRMLNALWQNFLSNESATSTPYWFDQFHDPRSFNQFIKTLSDEGWINSVVIPQRHWAEISINRSKLETIITPDELIELRKERKFNKYQMKCDTKLHSSIKTKINGKAKDTGLSRLGFAKAGTHKFKYDTSYIYKYYDAIVANVTKSIRKIENIHTLIEDGADYKSISIELVDYHMYSPDQEFTLGANFNDSRGRAISSALSKVFNPIGFKDARALIVTPVRHIPVDNKIVRQFTKAVYLFIAELHSFRISGSEVAKAKFGRQAYLDRVLPELDLSIDDSRSDLHELIWLERLYTGLDALFNRDISKPFPWDIPIELDASASMLQIEGALLNHAPYLEMTNCLTETGISDPWYHPELSRAHVKFAATPMLYGSSQPVSTLWSKNGLSYTSRQSAIMGHEIRNGIYQVANEMKNLIIENVQPQESMTVTIDGTTFDIECNRFKNVGEYTRRYPIYDTESRTVLAIAHTQTHKIADLKQFKRYFQTLLVHHIDSDIADDISKQIDWILSIHDAFIVHPLDALQVRTLYASHIERLHTNREDIINKYFSSIRLARPAIKAWAELRKSIVPVTGTFKCSLMALK